MFSNITLPEYFAHFGEAASAGRVDAEQVYIGQLAGLYELLNAGSTTTLDHAHHTWSDETSWAGLNASIESGARVFWSYAFHEVNNYTIAQQLVNFRDIALLPLRRAQVSSSALLLIALTTASWILRLSPRLLTWPSKLSSYLSELSFLV
jgi:hypothetical protein